MTICYYGTHARVIVYTITGTKDPLSVTQCHDTPKVHLSIDGRYEIKKASKSTQPTMSLTGNMYSYNNYELSCVIATV